ncbi:carboxymuconolactone decarboxylase family protein [uncultured Microbacterium sp.]|uniref:Carboxymuconolactone decarboxylase family protein n=1 Tax=uncultured Microbacterium sp. TaxID=191216 RepID=A0A1Y5NXT8_9MICO|nr:carboxymuconolactone decarboxylase family protein [uncultured Microbacterium sp.]SBS71196.1 Carboxymuconolactone decarboxylase family protein [uncultured Microbacterium sp.]
MDASAPPRVTPLTPAALAVDQRRLYDAITTGPRAQGPQHFALTRADGSLTGPFDAFLRAPAVGAALQELGATLRYRTDLDDRSREMAILLVAARWDSTFERESHEAVARGVGVTETEMRALRAADLTPFAGRELAVGRTVLALLDGDLDDEAWASGVAALGETVIFELTALVGYYATLALQLRVFRV